LNTQEFGQLWVQLQYEAKASLSSTHIFHLSISDVLEVLTEQLNFHRVNMIGFFFFKNTIMIKTTQFSFIYFFYFQVLRDLLQVH